jgi:hypothetical protein
LVVFRKFLVFWLSSRSSEAELIKFVSSGNAEVEWSGQRIWKQLTSYDRNHRSGIWYKEARRKPPLVQTPRLPIVEYIHMPVGRGLLQTHARKVILDLVYLLASNLSNNHWQKEVYEVLQMVMHVCSVAQVIAEERV